MYTLYIDDYLWHSKQYPQMGLALSFIHSYWPSKYIDGLVQACNIFSALVLEILQSWTKPSMCTYIKRIFTTDHGWTNLPWTGLLPCVRWQGCRAWRLHRMEAVSSLPALLGESTGHRCEALMFPLFSAWIYCWTNSRFADDLRRRFAHRPPH